MWDEGHLGSRRRLSEPRVSRRTGWNSVGDDRERDLESQRFEPVGRRAYQDYSTTWTHSRNKWARQGGVAPVGTDAVRAVWNTVDRSLGEKARRVPRRGSFGTGEMPAANRHGSLLASGDTGSCRWTRRAGSGGRI